ncbi:MAG: L-fucose/L-arabinose isomerase family protein [Spirochaetaceae bacterium]|jgi:L-arabinose isomerase|nr:L-fucose/L-arabinose isomerase family protein [Spirochaetaceae bacterium]
MEHNGTKTSDKTVRVGLFGVGLDTYWGQFEGLKDRLLGYHARIAERIAAFGVDIVDAGLVDNPDAARRAADLFQERGITLVFLSVSTYALSHTALPAVQGVGAPVIILNLQPDPAIDYETFNALGDRGRMTGEWLAYCQACSVPEIASVFNNAGIPYDIITGWLGDEASWEEIGDWCDGARVSAAVRETRIGILGHYYCGMLDVYTDVTRLAAVFGCHFEILEMDELKVIRDSANATDIAEQRRHFERAFDVSPECDVFELDRAAHTSFALERLVEKNRLGALAYYYEGSPGSDHENIVTSVIAGNTLLTASGVPVAGECEVKNVLAMKIMDCFGSGGSFSELYAMDFNDDVAFWGHDGPAHLAIAEGRAALVPLPVYHGKPGKGLSIQMSVKHGPVTFLSVVQGAGGSTFLLCAEGESVPGPVLHIGNTNSRYRFSIPARDFVNRWSKAGPAHHCAIGLGHIAGRIEKLARLLGIECRKIC